MNLNRVMGFPCWIPCLPSCLRGRAGKLTGRPITPGGNDGFLDAARGVMRIHFLPSLSSRLRMCFFLARSRGVAPSLFLASTSPPAATSALMT